MPRKSLNAETVTFSAGNESVTVTGEQFDNAVDRLTGNARKRAHQQEELPGLKLVAEVDTKSILIGKSQIIELWELGIYTHLAFVDAALKYERIEEGNINIDNFIFNWQGIPDPDTGRVKRLTKKQLLMAIATLEEKGVLRLTNSQLSLELQ